MGAAASDREHRAAALRRWNGYLRAGVNAAVPSPESSGHLLVRVSVNSPQIVAHLLKQALGAARKPPLHDAHGGLLAHLAKACGGCRAPRPGRQPRPRAAGHPSAQASRHRARRTGRPCWRARAYSVLACRAAAMPSQPPAPAPGFVSFPVIPDIALRHLSNDLVVVPDMSVDVDGVTRGGRRRVARLAAPQLRRQACSLSTRMNANCGLHVARPVILSPDASHIGWRRHQKPSRRLRTGG